MKRLTLALLMLRYRVALMLVLFFLLAAAFHRGLGQWRPAFVLVPLCLACGYITATCLNDISDVEIDRINHAGRKGRPLVTGEATSADLVVIAFLTAALALLVALPLGVAGLLLATSSIMIAAAYSLPPLRLSHHPVVTPLLLTWAYVGVPYGFGLVALGQAPSAADVQFVAALAALFAGRILLKDFRDRHGDARFGKRTLLLLRGKTFTCGLCLVAVLTGDALLTASLPVHDPLALASVQLLFAGVVAILVRAWRSDDELQEQVAIGLGARLGNGILVTILGLLALWSVDAGATAEAAFATLTAAAFGLNVVSLARRPPEVLLGYRG